MSNEPGTKERGGVRLCDKAFCRNAQPHEVSFSKGLGLSQQVAYEVRMDAHTLLARISEVVLSAGGGAF